MIRSPCPTNVNGNPGVIDTVKLMRSEWKVVHVFCLPTRLSWYVQNFFVTGWYEKVFWSTYFDGTSSSIGIELMGWVYGHALFNTWQYWKLTVNITESFAINVIPVEEISLIHPTLHFYVNLYWYLLLYFNHWNELCIHKPRLLSRYKHDVSLCFLKSRIIAVSANVFVDCTRLWIKFILSYLILRVCESLTRFSCGSSSIEGHITVTS